MKGNDTLDVREEKISLDQLPIHNIWLKNYHKILALLWWHSRNTCADKCNEFNLELTYRPYIYCRPRNALNL